MCAVHDDQGRVTIFPINLVITKNELNVSQPKRDVFFSFSNEYVLVVDCWKHLRHFIHPGARNTLYRDAAHGLARRVNGILSNFSFKLFTFYCTLYHGSCLWSLEASKIGQFYVAWRKSLRKIFKLPSRSHCKLPPIIANCIPIYEQLLCRLYKFEVEARNSNNIINRLLMSVALNGSKSSVSRSLHQLGAYVNETCAYFFTSHNFSSFGKLITRMYLTQWTRRYLLQANLQET